MTSQNSAVLIIVTGGVVSFYTNNDEDIEIAILDLDDIADGSPPKVLKGDLLQIARTYLPDDENYSYKDEK